MTYNSRLFSEPKLREIVAVTDEIANQCQIVSDALSDYESAADEPAGDRAGLRESAREQAFSAMGDLLSDASRLKAIYETLELASDGEVSGV